MSNTELSELHVKNILNKISSKKNLTYPDAIVIFKNIVEGRIQDYYSTSILKEISRKGETVDEIHAMVQIIKELSITIHPKIKNNIFDICGTGGSKIKTFNISTASAIVAASAGCNIAKHGNRAVSGICGSADFLEYIGLNLSNPPHVVTSCIEELGIGFLFAPLFHPVLKNVSKLRKEIGMKTIFNIAAPLCNPCDNLSGQIIGIYDSSLLHKFAEVTKKLNRNFILVNSNDGIDEISTTCVNKIIRVNKGEIIKFNLNPLEVGIPLASVNNITIKNKEDSIELTLKSIYGVARKEIEDIVALNSSSVLVLSEIAKNLQEGIDISRSVIREGKARKKLEDLITFCGNKERLYEIEKKFDLT
jgi:anthranilate phosphoribosyltransferase